MIKQYVIFTRDMFLSPDEIGAAIDSLTNNKSSGLDEIYAEHLKYCSERINYLLGCVLIVVYHTVIFPRI